MGDGITRRTVVSGAATVVASVPALAQTQATSAAAPAREKGPIVWLDMDQRQLDDAYDQIKYAPNLPQVVKRYSTNSDGVRARLGPAKRLSYGATPIEGMDLYTTRQ